MVITFSILEIRKLCHTRENTLWVCLTSESKPLSQKFSLIQTKSVCLINLSFLNKLVNWGGFKRHSANWNGSDNNGNLSANEWFCHEKLSANWNGSDNGNFSVNCNCYDKQNLSVNWNDFIMRTSNRIEIWSQQIISSPPDSFPSSLSLVSGIFLLPNTVHLFLPRVDSYCALWEINASIVCSMMKLSDNNKLHELVFYRMPWNNKKAGMHDKSIRKDNKQCCPRNSYPRKVICADLVLKCLQKQSRHHVIRTGYSSHD